MKRLAVTLAAFFVLAPTAAANIDAGPKPFHAVTSAPEGLHAFLLRPDETPQKYYPRTPSFAWSPVDARGGTYEFELSTSRSFNDASVLFNYTKLTIPAVSIAHQLPWMTGVPYALWAHVRWVSANGKQITPWSAPFGFNMRWADSDYPQQLTAPEGLVRWKPIEGVFLSNRGLVLPSIPLGAAQLWVLLSSVIGLIALYAIRKRLIARQMLDGRARPIWPYALALLIGLPALTSLALGASWTITLPELRGFNFVGGLTLAPEYFALLVALTTYTSAFIAEIVRSGIQSVSRGQWDAAMALGLRRSFVLRQIVMPQALRVIIPPMTSQYLNLTKNSSLAVAVGYQDIVSIANTTLNQTGQAIEAIALIMLVFLTISLGISLFMNWYNARIALVEH